LNYEYETEKNEFTTEEFDELIKDLKFTDGEFLSLNTRRQPGSTLQIMKAVLSRVGIKLGIGSILVYNKKAKKQERQRSTYTICRDSNVYAVLHNMIVSDETKYNDNFVDMVKTYDKYKEYHKF